MNSFKLKTWLKENKKTWQIWIILLLLSLVFAILQHTDKKTSIIDTQNIDTYIPEGFVLVPVELNNGPSLDGLLANKGVVDLYTGDPSHQKAEKAATAVKIIRSPRNPSYFAVLVPENKAPLLIKRFQAFHAVIQNPEQKKKTTIQPVNKKNKRTIVIELDNSPHF